MTRSLALFFFLSLAACVNSGTVPDVAPGAPDFAPIAFFAGRTEGNGTLRVTMSGARAVHVTGTGRVAPDGSLTLDQRVEQQGSPARDRTWSIRRVDGGGYRGTLSDAVGPVAIAVDGGRLHIRFAAKGGVTVEQWLVLDRGGQVARNHLVARKLGLRVAVLDETIRKLD